MSDAKPPLPTPLRRWLFGDLDTPEFESWLYENVPLLEQELGLEDADALVALNFRDPYVVLRKQEALFEKLFGTFWAPRRVYGDCPCGYVGARLRLPPNLQIAPPDPAFIARIFELSPPGRAGDWAERMRNPPPMWLERVRQRTPWLVLLRCSACGQHWYQAFDTIDDYIFLERVGPEVARAIVERDVWPATFDRFRNVWSGEPAEMSGPPAGFTSCGEEARWVRAFVEQRWP